MAECVECDLKEPPVLVERGLRATLDPVFFEKLFSNCAEASLPCPRGYPVQLALRRRINAIRKQLFRALAPCSRLTESNNGMKHPG